jgi:predicted ATPase
LLLGIGDESASLVQMDPQIRRQRTLEAVKRVLLRETLDQPCVLIFEDLHWIDAETQAFLDLLSESAATARLLLLVDYRPEYQHGWGSKTYYTQLRLDPLGEEEARELLTALLGEGASAEWQALERLILEKTEGNPFFIEEVVQALAEEGVLAGERGRYRLERAPGELQIPATVQGVLAARIDRLPAQEKDLLQTLAVIGKEFPFGLLRRVAEAGEEELHGRLSHLQAGEFIYEQPAFPEPEYIFKHALTQEVAYHSLLGERRKRLHERTARAIEERYRDALDEHYGELAHHYGRAENTPKAVEYLYLAGEQAVQRSAYAEAIDQLIRGVELVETLPETRESARQELPLQIALGEALTATQGYTDPEMERAFVRARDLCGRLGEAPQLFHALFGLYSLHLSRAEHERAAELVEDLLRLARGTRDPVHLVWARIVAGEACLWRGEFSQAREHLEEAIERCDPQEFRSRGYLFYQVDPGSWALVNLAWALGGLGYPEQALTRSREAVAVARELAHPFSEANALLYACGIHWLRRDAQAVLETAEAAIALSGEQGFPQPVGFGAFYRAAALAEQGQLQEGIAGIRAIVKDMRGAGMEAASPVMLGALARAHGNAGQAEEGLAVIAEAQEFVARTGERAWEADIHRIKAELLLVRSPSDPAEAEACFREALDVARQQSARSFELRAATSLARLWQQQDRRQEAHALLAPVYDWFTEGFDTKDLR